MQNITAIFPENEPVFKQLRERAELFRVDPRKIYPWWPRPCIVKVLLLADGFLNFGLGDFGLSTFVGVLANDGRNYVKFDITIAHRTGFVGNPGITVNRSISNFMFTNSAHFTESMYDQVWMFGYNSSGGELNENELKILGKFMNGGGGVFATGDHGELGRSLCGAVTRVRSMRRWNNSSGEVGMNDPRRNDTNRVGHDAGTQFEDQSDDIPQPLQLKLYSSYLHRFWRETYPHPLLCSPLGRITILPDHPHEGECIQPRDLTQIYIDGTPEYPMGIAPELIAFSSVPAGNTSGKQATQAHTFGAICAYDGHRAKVGRVVTDATWHHFVNVNLIGDSAFLDTEIKGLGFLASTSGQQYFRFIKHYYVNIAVWISRLSNHRCFNWRSIWELIFHHRVLEATMDNPNLKFDKISPSLLYAIGTHATDVLGKSASQCRRVQFLINIFEEILPNFAQLIDPWIPMPDPGHPGGGTVPDPRPEPNPPLPWIDYNPLFSFALGAGLLAIRDKIGYQELQENDKIGDLIMEAFMEGARRGVKIGIDSFNREIKRYSDLKG